MNNQAEQQFFQALENSQSLAQFLYRSSDRPLLYNELELKWSKDGNT